MTSTKKRGLMDDFNAKEKRIINDWTVFRGSDYNKNAF